MSSRLSAHDLSVRYAGAAAPALDRVSFELANGERLAIIGESGSGKSTLALAVAGLLPPRTAVSGRIEWPDLNHSPANGRDIGFVFQDAGASLDPVMRVGRQIAEVAYTQLGIGWQTAHATAIELIGRVRLPEPARIAEAFPHQLSGGQKQRVAIAAAIAARPKLLIADEPTSALDTIVQAEVISLIDRLVMEDGLSLIFISHDIALASTIADRIAVFHAGRTVEIGMTEDIVGRPREAYTRALIEAAAIPLAPADARADP